MKNGWDHQERVPLELPLHHPLRKEARTENIFISEVRGRTLRLEETVELQS